VRIPGRGKHQGAEARGPGSAKGVSVFKREGVICLKSALEAIPEKIFDLIQNHEKDLEEAWKNCGESDVLSISFPVKIAVTNNKQLCEVGISFAVSKVKDSTTFEWNDAQLSLLKTARKT
jgi:hypothetical protein